MTLFLPKNLCFRTKTLLHDTFFSEFVLCYASTNTTSRNIGGTEAWAVPTSNLGGPSPLSLCPWACPSLVPLLVSFSNCSYFHTECSQFLVNEDHPQLLRVHSMLRVWSSADLVQVLWDNEFLLTTPCLSPFLSAFTTWNLSNLILVKPNVDVHLKISAFVMFVWLR